MPSARIVRLTLALIIGALAAFATYRFTMYASTHRSAPSVPDSPGPLF